MCVSVVGQTTSRGMLTKSFSSDLSGRGVVQGMLGNLSHNAFTLFAIFLIMHFSSKLRMVYGRVGNDTLTHKGKRYSISLLLYCKSLIDFIN